MEENKNNKKKILILGILLVIVTIGVLGITYAAYNFQREGDSNELVTGDIYMHYKGQNTGINIDNAVPSETYDEDEYFEFTIEGKNTYTEKDIWYEIDLVYGDQPEDRTIRLRDVLLKFTLFEKVGDDGGETKVLDGVSYDEINNKRIWVNKINKNTTEETKITYKLYMWISNDTVIGDNGNYTSTEWNENVYASVKVNVKGDFNEKTKEQPFGTMITKILSKADTNEKEIIALNVTDKNNVTKCDSVEACRGKKIEYRYSGPEVKNYIYLKDNNNSNELWRIIGVFEDDEVGEYIKVVRDEVLPESYLPAKFKASDGNTYTIQSTNSSYKYYAYWNNLTGTSSDKNNWSTAGLQYWLNAEEEDTEGNKNYLSYLSSDVRDQLVGVKHYLGTMHVTSTSRDTPKEAYAHERDVESCEGGKGPVGNTIAEAITSSIGCQVWADNDAIWPGKVSLMYPSDYGFSASEENWTSPFWGGSETGFEDVKVNGTSWMYSTMPEAKINYSWLLSPTSYDVYGVASWGDFGGINFDYVYGIGHAVQPVLNLSTSTSYVKGDGTVESPYEIIAD